VSDILSRTYLAVADALMAARHRARSEAGEGVISAAIVVLIMAILGAAMWFAFNDVFTGASEGIADNVGQIGG
jgi:hypothetical protein